MLFIDRAMYILGYKGLVGLFFGFNDMHTKAAFEFHDIPVILPRHGCQRQDNDKRHHDIGGDANDIGIIVVWVPIKDQAPCIDKAGMGKEIQSHDEEIDAQKARTKNDDVAFQKVHSKRKDNTEADNKTDPCHFLQWTIVSDFSKYAKKRGGGLLNLRLGSPGILSRTV